MIFRAISISISTIPKKKTRVPRLRRVWAWASGSRILLISRNSSRSSDRSGKNCGVVYMEVLLVWNRTATEVMLIPAFIRNSGSPKRLRSEKTSSRTAETIRITILSAMDGAFLFPAFFSRAFHCNCMLTQTLLCFKGSVSRAAV